MKGNVDIIQWLNRQLQNELTAINQCVACDLKLEIVSRETLIAAIAICETAKDYVSRELFEHILEDTEEHIDWLETQLALMHKVGIHNWLQSQI